MNLKKLIVMHQRYLQCVIMRVSCHTEEVNVGVKKVAYGRNNFNKQYNTPSLHAEMDAFNKLKPYYANKQLDLMVVRISNSGELCSSRPCYHCLRTLHLSNINIKNVYYSNEGEIHKEKFSTMIESNNTCISYGMRKKKI